VKIPWEHKYAQCAHDRKKQMSDSAIKGRGTKFGVYGTK